MTSGIVQAIRHWFAAYWRSIGKPILCAKCGGEMHELGATGHAACERCAWTD